MKKVIAFIVAPIVIATVLTFTTSCKKNNTQPQVIVVQAPPTQTVVVNPTQTIVVSQTVTVSQPSITNVLPSGGQWEMIQSNPQPDVNGWLTYKYKVPSGYKLTHVYAIASRNYSEALYMTNDGISFLTYAGYSKMYNVTWTLEEFTLLAGKTLGVSFPADAMVVGVKVYLRSI